MGTSALVFPSSPAADCTIPEKACWLFNPELFQVVAKVFVKHVVPLGFAQWPEIMGFFFIKVGFARLLRFN